MSSMTRLPFLALALVSTTSITPPAFAQDAASWDRARADLIATAPTQMAQVIARWEYLIEQRDLPCAEVGVDPKAPERCVGEPADRVAA